MKPNLKKLQAECDAFNAKCPVGGTVLVKLDGKDEPFATTTCSEAQILSGHSAVIWMNGVSGCYLLNRVTPVAPDVDYYIASLKHTNKGHEHITFWGPEHRSYTMVFGVYMGKYDETEAIKLNDGVDCIAVPTDVVHAMQSPEPYYKPGARFYDQRGPVVNNTRTNWNALISGSLQTGLTSKPKPEPFRGKRRAIFTEGDQA